MTNLKKGLFELHIIGDPSKKKVLLIHGMGFQWKFCFKKVIEELKRNYCLILPELGGHNMQGLGGFSNVYESRSSNPAVLVVPVSLRWCSLASRKVSVLFIVIVCNSD